MWFWVIVLIVVCWALGSVKQRSRRNCQKMRLSPLIMPSPDSKQVLMSLPAPTVIKEEAFHRKRATELKKQKRFSEAAQEMWLSYKANQNAGELTSIETLYRYPKYLFLAGDYAGCAAACERMVKGEPFGNLGAGACDCQRKRIFLSLAADAHDELGNTNLAASYRLQVETAGSDNQIHVDRSVTELVKNGCFVARISDNCSSEHPLYEKLKGSLIALVATDQYKFPMYASIRETGLFADDDYPVGIQYVDEEEIKRG